MGSQRNVASHFGSSWLQQRVWGWGGSGRRGQKGPQGWDLGKRYTKQGSLGFILKHCRDTKRFQASKEMEEISLSESG